MGGYTGRARFLNFHEIARLHWLRRGRIPGAANILPPEPKKRDARIVERISPRKERIAEILNPRKTPKEKLPEMERELDAVGVTCRVGNRSQLAVDNVTVSFDGIDNKGAILNLWIEKPGSNGCEPLLNERGEPIRLIVPDGGYTEAIAVDGSNRYLIAAAGIEPDSAVRVFTKKLIRRAETNKRAAPELKPLVKGYEISDSFSELQEIFTAAIVQQKERGKNTPKVPEEEIGEIRNGDAKVLAQKTAEAMQLAAENLGLGFCVLNSRGRASCKWDGVFRPFVTLGIIREDGKVSPIVIHEDAICKYTGKNKTGNSWKGVPTAMAREIMEEGLCPESFDILKVREASQEELDKELFEAISHSRIYDVWIALEDGADPNARFEDGNPALLYAVSNYDITKLLLEKGANPNVVGETDGRTPLMKAAMTEIKESILRRSALGKTAMIDLLIEHGAEVDYLGKGAYKGQSALDCAISAYMGEKTERLSVLQALRGEKLQRILDEKIMQRSYWWQPDKMRKLLEKGANPNVKREGDNNPVLALAIEGGEKEAALILIEGGADPNAYSGMIEAPVLIAAFYFDSGGEVARALIKAGAQLSVRGKDDRSPLEWAIDHDDDETCQMLLDAGVSPNERLRATIIERPLLKALRDKRTKVAEVLKKNGAMIMPREKLNEKLLDAAHYLYIEGVKEALEWGADPNAKDSTEYGETTLIKICKEGDSNGTNPKRIEIARALVDAGADVDSKSEMDCTPLSESCSFGHLEIVKILLENKANPNLKGNAGIPPIISAASGRVPEGHNSTEIVQLLIDAGADVNAQAELNIAEKTALHAAAKAGKPEIVKLLLEHGADASVKNCDNQDARQIAAFDGEYDEETINVLEENSKEEQDKKLLKAAEAGDSRAAAKAMDKGARFNAKDSVNRTALMIALLHGHESEGHLDTAHTLLNYGASVNVTDKYGNTPLYYAVTAGEEIVERLIKMGAEVNPQFSDNGIKSPLSAPFGSPLIKAASSGSLEVLRLLLDNGADVNVRGFNGTAALIVAARNNGVEHLKLLLKHGADVHATDDDGESAIRAAMTRNEPERTEILEAIKLSLGIVNSKADAPIPPMEKMKKRIEASKLAGHVNGFGLDSRESFFRAAYAQRMLNKGKSRTGMTFRIGESGLPKKEEELIPEGEFERLRDCDDAGEFAKDMIGQLKEMADKLGHEICTINPVIIDGLPGSAMNLTPPAISIVVGLIREDGKITPIAISDEYIMFQTGSAPFTVSYNQYDPDKGKLTCDRIGGLAAAALMDGSYI